MRSKHFLQRGNQKSRCAECYLKLRATLNSVEAANKTKLIETHCAQCKQPMCLPCFIKKHYN